MPVVLRLASAASAARQAGWIAAMEPWRGLGIGEAALAGFLRRAARDRQVWLALATEGPGRGSGARHAGARRVTRQSPIGLLVLQPGVLLGGFVALLAVMPVAAGRGVGRRLMARAEARTFAHRRWLFVSADAANTDALRFYRRLGFARVARLPDLVRAGRTEILLRKARPSSGFGARRRAANGAPRVAPPRNRTRAVARSARRVAVGPGLTPWLECACAAPDDPLPRSSATA